jgi:hypothetical protein
LADDDQPPVIHLTGSDENLADLVVLCPQGAEPRFKNQKTGEMFPISDPRLRAIAKKACQSSLGLAEGSSNVNIVNTTGGPIWVGFFPKRVLRLIGVRVAQPSLPRQSKFRTEPAKLPWCSTLMPIPVRGSVP